MKVDELLKEGRDIWKDRRMSLSEIIPAMGKVFGDICRNARNEKKGDYNEEELKKEMGNIIFSTIRWSNDLGFNPEECIELAKKCQKDYSR